MRALALLLAAGAALAGGAAWVHASEPAWYLRARYPLEYGHILRSYARERGLDPALVAAVVYAESGFDPNARSSAGALGLMQLLPETAQGIARRTGATRFLVADLRDPEINVRYGTWYLAHLLRAYGDVETALAAYHAGRGNVDRWRRGDARPFPETRAYVERVQQARSLYARAYGPALGAS